MVKGWESVFRQQSWPLFSRRKVCGGSREERNTNIVTQDRVQFFCMKCTREQKLYLVKKQNGSFFSFIHLQASSPLLSEHGSLRPAKWKSSITECILSEKFTSPNEGPNVNTKIFWQCSNNFYANTNKLQKILAISKWSLHSIHAQLHKVHIKDWHNMESLLSG